MNYKSKLPNTIILTAFVFDFAGLSIVRIFVELHRTRDVIIDPAKKNGRKMLFLIRPTENLLFLGKEIKMEV